MATQALQVVCRRRSVGPGDDVVDVAPSRWPAAAGEPTVDVPCFDEMLQPWARFVVRLARFDSDTLHELVTHMFANDVEVSVWSITLQYLLIRIIKCHWQASAVVANGMAARYVDDCLQVCGP